jgi:hypothetical protein
LRNCVHSGERGWVGRALEKLERALLLLITPELPLLMLWTAPATGISMCQSAVAA